MNGTKFSEAKLISMWLIGNRNDQYYDFAVNNNWAQLNVSH